MLHLQVSNCLIQVSNISHQVRLVILHQREHMVIMVLNTSYLQTPLQTSLLQDLLLTADKRV